MADPDNLVPWVPLPPPSTGFISIQITPTWLPQMAVLMSNGVGGIDNGITFDNQGDLIVYRKLSDDDRKSFPVLRNVDEIWLSLSIDEL